MVDDPTPKNLDEPAKASQAEPPAADKPGLQDLKPDTHVWRTLTELGSASGAEWKDATGLTTILFQNALMNLRAAGCVTYDAEKKVFTPVREPTKADYKAPRQVQQDPSGEDSTAIKRGTDVGIAEDFIKTVQRDAIYDEGKFWRFDKTHWKEIPPHQIEQQLHKYDGMPAGKDAKPINLGQGRILSIVAIVAAKLTKPDFFANAAVGINCEAGFISFADGGTPTLQPHSKDHRQRHVMQGTWTPGSNADQLVRDCLQTNFKGDEDAEQKIDALGEAAGAAMLGKAVHKGGKALWLYGDTADNGKSTVIDFIAAGVPSTSSVSVPPHKLGDRQFSVTLAGKLLNTVGELDTSAIPATVFKSMITGDKITGKEVYLPVCTFTPTAQHIYGCNRLPSFQGGMGWEIRKRILPIAFNRTIPEEERNDLLERIPIDHPGAFLVFAVKGAARWLKQGKRFTAPDSSAELLERWSLDADPVLDWVEQRVAPSSALHVVGEKPTETSAAACFKDFQLWAAAEGLDPRDLPRQKGFTDRAKTALRKRGITYKKSGTFRGFVGLRLHPVTEVMMEDKSELLLAV
jgi:phage/plasmid-associated DNA primase